MKVKISIPQIRARNITHPRTDSDEIYTAYFVTLARSGDNLDTSEVRKYVAKCVSDVRRRVRKNRKWTPKNMETVVDLGDAEVMFITLGVYEYDNGNIYKRMLNESSLLENPGEFDWSVIEIPVNLTDVMAWVKSIWKLVSYSFNYLMEDDLIGVTCIAITDLNKEHSHEWGGTRELKFKSWGGDYRVAVDLEVLEES